MRSPDTSSGEWMVYLARCDDDTLYCGITTDVERRIRQHNQGQGARYTRARSPVKLVYAESHADRASASKREYEIKQMSRQEKDDLMEGGGR